MHRWQHSCFTDLVRVRLVEFQLRPVWVDGAVCSCDRSSGKRAACDGEAGERWNQVSFASSWSFTGRYSYLQDLKLSNAGGSPWGKSREEEAVLCWFPSLFLLPAVYAVHFNAINKETTRCPPSTDCSKGDLKKTFLKKLCVCLVWFGFGATYSPVLKASGGWGWVLQAHMWFCFALWYSAAPNPRDRSGKPPDFSYS